MATEVKYLSDTWRMIRNCEISPQRAREEVRFLINLIRAVISEHEAERSKPAPLKRPNRTGPSPEVLAHVETEPPFVVEPQPAPAPAGDVPEWCVDRIRGLVGIWDRDRNALHPHVAIKAIRWLLDKAESELARRVAESNTAAEHRIAQRDAEIERLKSELTKWESEPVGKMITDLRDEERESKNSDIRKLRSKIDELLNENAANVEENDRLKAELAESRKSGRAACESLADCIALKDKRTEERDKLKAELAEATKPVEDREIDEHTSFVPVNTYGDGFVGVSVSYVKEFVQRERAARLAAEQRLTLTREAWRHRWVSRDGELGPKFTPLTDADTDAAIEAHEKSKETSDGAR